MKKGFLYLVIANHDHLNTASKYPYHYFEIGSEVECTSVDNFNSAGECVDHREGFDQYVYDFHVIEIGPKK